jgi:predicted nucleotidyltransferase
MNALIQSHLPALESLCKKYAVSELYLFGSALTEDFSEESDLDFAVVFQSHLSPVEYGSAYLDLLGELENLFNRKIDLVSYRVIKNPVFKAELDRTKQTLYAAA